MLPKEEPLDVPDSGLALVTPPPPPPAAAAVAPSASNAWPGSCPKSAALLSGRESR